MNVKEFILHPTMCSLPWVGLHVNPSGKVFNCACTLQPLGNLKQQTIDECVHGPVNKQIKHDMINKVAHARCSACYDVEKFSGNNTINESNRTWYKRYGIRSLDMSIYDNTDAFDLRVLDLRWSNTCNQACVYCGPELSSKWAQELNDHRWSIDDSILDANKNYIFDRLANVKHVYLAGGEPLLMKDNQELLARLLVVNPQVEIRINTNLSKLDTPVFQLLQQFSNVKWTVSVEASGDQYNYIRWPGDWNVFWTNLQTLRQHTENINFNMVWCALNSTALFDCIDFFDQHGFQENMYIIQCLNKPTHLDVRNLPANQILQLQQLISDRLQTANASQWLAKCLTTMYNFTSSSGPLTIGHLQQFLQTLDQRRHLDSKKVFPHIYDSI